MFDFWYGPAVLSKKPEVRLKNLENEQLKVTRIASPVLHDDMNIVDVNYQIYVHEKETKKISLIEETHKMRYLFLNELERLLGTKGFLINKVEEWMTGNSPSVDTWSVCIVASRK